MWIGVSRLLIMTVHVQDTASKGCTQRTMCGITVDLDSRALCKMTQEKEEEAASKKRKQAVIDENFTPCPIKWGWV